MLAKKEGRKKHDKKNIATTQSLQSMRVLKYLMVDWKA